MPFVIQRVAGRGLALTQVMRTSLRIGRGTNADVRSENPAVALEHAVIEGLDDSYTVVDKGSITGTYVNGKPVESAALKKGDVIEIGDLRLEVQLNDPGKPLFLRVGETRAAAAAGPAEDEEDIEARKRVKAGGGAVLKAPKIDYVGAYRLRRPYLTKLTLIAALLIVALALIGEVIQPGKQSAFMPGGVSSAHSRARDANGNSIANDCRACHDPWRGVTDNRCTACHGPKAHSERQTNAPACMDCHPEHRANPKLAATLAASQCVTCHGNLRAHIKGSEPPSIAEKVSSFAGDHPEFDVRADPDTLRLNHKLHLRPQGLPNASGVKEALTCASCHKLVATREGKYDPAPIKFEQHCQRCHRLTFDPRFPDTEVPHGGDPGLTYGFIITTYAGSRDIIGKSPEEIRRIITGKSQVTPDASALLNASQVIKVKCSLCHEVRRDEAQQRFVATPPVIPTQWLTRADFTHTQHRQIDCEKCHQGVRDSFNTSDVLMPKKKDCVECHGPQNIRVALAGTTVSSGCTSCHREYHVRTKNVPGKLPLQAGRTGGGILQSNIGGGAGMLGTILLWAIVMLMVVVLVPLGIAFYQRLRATDADRASAKAPQKARPAAPKVPPIAPSAVPPAGGAPRPPAAPKAPAPPKPAAPASPAAPAAPPPRPAAPPAAATQMIDMAKPAEPAAGGTEMMQWYGMLVCTAGPIEGQRFIVEDEGFYIGRDPALSKVVVNDTRISKRHVRIVPRNGKVFAIDQNSTNGTFLGKPGGQRITEVQLKRGDTIVLADNAATFLYQI
jgi:pSer/pThr/pTyr-binding forkhead associated (FHA) protein